MGGRTYRFGDLEVDEDRLELRRGSERIAIQAKPLDVLLYLLRHRDRVVTKDELLARLWPGVAVTEASLSKAVSGVRRAIRGTMPDPIETVRGRGFSFAASVEEVPAAGPLPQTVGDGPFVGREDVLATLAGVVTAARRGAGRLVLLAGAAGMGKTRVALEAAARAGAAGIPAHISWCTEGGGTPDLWPWLHVLRPLLARHDPRALVDGLGDAVADLAAHLPQLAPHAGLRQAPPEPEHARHRLFEVVVELLARAARREPMLVVLDDAHWADRDSLLLLELLARGLASVPLALLVTYRDDELATGHPLTALARLPASAALVLRALGAGDVGRLAAAELQAEPDATLVAAIHERTGGNPFFVKEIARALHARGRPYDAAGLEHVPLSAGLRHVLQARLDRLSAGCRELLALCATMGAEVALVAVACASGRPAAEVLQLFDEARRAYVLVETRDGWRFAHALVRDALLEGLPAVERARLHRCVGIALEDLHRDHLDAHLGELAHHFAAGAVGGDVERAVRYARLAGERAAGLLVYGEAAEHYRRGLEALALRPTRDEAAEADLLLALGEAQMFSGQPEVGRETLARAAAAARRLGSPTHLARAALASAGLELSGEVGFSPPAVLALFEEALAALPTHDTLLGVRLLARLAVMSLWTGRRGRSDDLARQAVAAARRLGDPVALCYALYGRHWATLGPAADLAPQLAGADEMLALAAGTQRRELELTAHSLRFLVLLELGRVAEAETELDAYEELVSRVRVPRYRWRAGFYRTTLAFLRGRFAEVEERIQQTLAEEERFRPADFSVGQTQLFWLLRERGRLADVEPTLRALPARFPSLAAAWRTVLALVLAESARAAEARELIDTLARDDFAALSRNFLWVPAVVLLGEACVAVGDEARAARLYELLLPHRPRTVVLSAGTLCFGSLDLALGRLAAGAGRMDAALGHLAAALETNSAMGARPWAAWTSLELACVLARRDAAAAADHLARARETAAALGMGRLAERCTATGLPPR